MTGIDIIKLKTVLRNEINTKLIFEEMCPTLQIKS